MPGCGNGVGSLKLPSKGSELGYSPAPPGKRRLRAGDVPMLSGILRGERRQCTPNWPASQPSIACFRVMPQ